MKNCWLREKVDKFHCGTIVGWSFAALAALLLLLLSACTVGPKYHPVITQAPTVYKESPTQFKEAGSWTVAQPADAKLRGKWWEIFNDPELNALEEQLDINNQNIKQFFENFMAARAIVREARAQYFPALTPCQLPAAQDPQAICQERPQRTLAGPPPSSLCPLMLPGRPTYGARSATPCIRRSTPPRSVPLIWRMSG